MALALASLCASTRAAAISGRVSLPPRRGLGLGGGPSTRASVVARQVLGVRPLEPPSGRRLGALAGAAAAVAAVARRRRTASGQVAACATTASGHGRVAVDGDRVLVHYEGRFEDGGVFDSSRGRSPLGLTIGKGEVVPGFEAAVRGLAIGEKVTVTLPPAQAYGERSEDRVLHFPKGRAPEGLELGAKVMLGSQAGQQIQATVTELHADGAVTVDANHELAGKTLVFDIELADFPEPLAPAKPPAGLEHATFAAGCFWGVELAFQRVPGVVSTNVGYAQGQKQEPTYEEVCGAETGHTEAVRIVFNPGEVTFEQLLQIFWERVGGNATTLHQAGNDHGPQYRSGIYYHNEAQQKTAAESVAALQAKLGQKVVVEVEEAAPFWFAEDYHQQYLEKGGGGKPQSAEKGSSDTIRCYG